MGFTEAIQTCFSKYATFSGRARRSEYWYFFLCYTILTGILSFLARNSTVLGYVSGVIEIALFIPMLAVSVRRLHDIGKSGWFYLIGLIPLVGFIIMIVWYCRDSAPGQNMYGPNPKGIGNGGGMYY